MYIMTLSFAVLYAHSCNTIERLLHGEKQNTTYVIVALFLLWASDCGEAVVQQ
jgi:hypothetical protein